MKKLINKLIRSYIRGYIRKRGGGIQFQDGMWLVLQSDEFHKYCYNEAYERFKNDKRV